MAVAVPAQGATKPAQSAIERIDIEWIRGRGLPGTPSGAPFPSHLGVRSPCFEGAEAQPRKFRRSEASTRVEPRIEAPAAAGDGRGAYSGALSIDYPPAAVRSERHHQSRGVRDRPRDCSSEASDRRRCGPPGDETASAGWGEILPTAACRGDTRCLHLTSNREPRKERKQGLDGGRPRGYKALVLPAAPRGRQAPSARGASRI